MEKLKNLLTVKSIVTIILTLAFVYGFCVGVVDGQQFVTIYTTVIAFYFGTQVEKKKEVK